MNSRSCRDASRSVSVCSDLLSDERAAAVDALKRARGGKFVDLVKSSAGSLSRQGQEAVQAVLQARGVHYSSSV